MAGSVFLVKDGSVFKVQNWNFCFDAMLQLFWGFSFLFMNFEKFQETPVRTCSALQLFSDFLTVYSVVAMPFPSQCTSVAHESLLRPTQLDAYTAACTLHCTPHHSTSNRIMRYVIVSTSKQEWVFNSRDCFKILANIYYCSPGYFFLKLELRVILCRGGDHLCWDCRFVRQIEFFMQIFGQICQVI